MAFRNISVVITANSSKYVAAMQKATAATQTFANTARTASANSGMAAGVASVTNAANKQAAAMKNASGAANMFNRTMGSTLAHTAHTSAAHHRQNIILRAMAEQTGLAAKAMAGLRTAAIATTAAFGGFIAINTAINVFKSGLDLLVKGYMDFQNNIVESMAIIEGATDGLKASFEQASMELSKTTIFSPAELAEGIYFLASAGFEGANALNVLGTAAQFAQAGLMDMDRATEILVDVNTALGGFLAFDPRQTAENVKFVSDVITRVAIDSNATLEQVGQAFTSKLATQLRSLKRTAREGAIEGGAMIATLAAQGVKAQQAGTYGQMAIRDLSGKALKNASAFARLGIEVYDAEGRFRNFALIIKDMEEALLGLPIEKQRELIMGLGLPDRSVQAILAFLGNSDQLLRQQEKNAKSAGATASIAEKQLDSLQKKMKLVQNAIARFGIGLGKTILSGIDAISREVGPTFEAVRDAVVAVWEVVEPVAKLFAAAFGGTLLGALKIVSRLIKTIAEQVERFSPIVGAVAIFGFGKWISQLGLIKTGLTQINTLMKTNLALKPLEGALMSYTAPAANLAPLAAYSANYKHAIRQAQGMLAITGRTSTAMEGLKMRAAAAGSAMTAALGAAVSGGTILIGVLAGVAAGYMFATSKLKEGEAAAKKWVDAQTAGFSSRRMGSTAGEGSGMLGRQQRLLELIAENERKLRKASWGFSSDSMMGKAMQVSGRLKAWKVGFTFLLPGGDDMVKLTDRRKQLEKELGGLQWTLMRHNKTIINLRKGRNAEFSAEYIEREAVRRGINLAGKNAKERAEAELTMAAALDEVRKKAKSAGMALADYEELTEEGANALEELDKAARDSVKGMFSLESAMQKAQKRAELFRSSLESPEDVFGNFKQAAEDAAQEAANAAAEAQEKAIEAQKDALDKAYEAQAEALEKRIRRARNPRVKERLEDEKEALKDSIDAQKDALDKQRKNAEDFYKKPTLSIGDFLGQLQQSAAESQRFNDLLRQASEAGADTAVIEMFRNLGKEGLPLLEQFVANAGTYVEQFNAEMRKFEPPAVTIEDAFAALAEQAAAGKGFLADMASARGYIRAYGEEALGFDNLFTPEIFFKQLAKLGPEIAGPLMKGINEALARGDLTGAKMLIETAKYSVAFEEVANTAIDSLSAISDEAERQLLTTQGTVLSTAQLTADQIREMFSSIPSEVVAMMANLQRQLGLSQIGPTNWVAVEAALTGGGKDAKGKPLPPIGEGAAGGGYQKPIPEGGGRAAGRPTPKGMHGPILQYPQDEWERVKKVDFAPRALQRGDAWIWLRGDRYIQRRVGFFAQGGINENHKAQISRPTLRVWAEPETGGEAYIPLSPTKRHQSELILSEVANRFGYKLMKYANGGLEDSIAFLAKGHRAMAGRPGGGYSGMFNTSIPFSSLTKIPGREFWPGGRFGPQQHVQQPRQERFATHQNIYQFNGPIQGVDMNDAIRYADRKKRHQSLSRR